MRIDFRLFLTSFLFATLLNATNVAAQPFSYREKWAEADSLARILKPESVKEVIGRIAEQATKENNTSERVKAFSALQFLSLKEVLPNNPMPVWQAESEQLNLSGKAVLKAFEGEFLLNIYKKERWNILDRTSGGSDSTDINTWDANFFVRQIDRCFTEALQHPESLAVISAKDYRSLTANSDSDWNRTPTLLDLVVRKALEFYQDGSLFTEPVPLPGFAMQKSAFGLSVPGKEIIDTKTPVNFYDRTLLLFGLLEKFHHEDGNSVALFYACLDRMDYMYRETSLQNADELYLNGLHELGKTVGNSALLADIWEKEADFYRMRGNQFRENVPQTGGFRMDLLRAAQLYEKSWQRFPKTAVGIRCFNQFQQLHQSQLSVQSEPVVRPEYPFAVKLNYRNLKNVTVSLRKINQKVFQRQILNKGNQISEEDSSWLNRFTIIRKNQFTLLPDSDLRLHNTELVIAPLNTGVYILKISCNHDSCRAFFPFTVSETYIEQQRTGEGTTFTVRRQSNGKGIQGAVLNFTDLYDKQINENSILTNDHGNAFWPGAGNSLTIILPGDTLAVRWHKPYYRKPVYKPSEKTWLFTDRSIYRPSQEVLFKAISLRTSGDTSHIVAGKPMVIFLRDSHNQTIDSLKLVTNSFGSASGKFHIPSGSMAGNFVLRTSDGQESIRVEAYRRPGFHIAFDKLGGQYETGHPVTITGVVTSSNGVPLAGVPGMFKVTRQLNWFERSRKNAGHFISGMFTTDEDGRFRFAFTPDSSEYNGNAYYHIETEVTDISGETQKAEQSLTLAKKALFARISVPNQVDASDKAIRKGKGIKVNIDFVNSLNHSIPVQGTLTFMQLETPGKSLRERIWEKPDRPIYSEAEWSKVFPDNLYGDEVKPEDFPVKRIMSTVSFNTTDRSWCFLPGEKLKPGNYKVVAETVDAFGQKVRGEKIIQVIRSNRSANPFVESFHVNLENTTVKPGETLKLELGTPREVYWQISLEEPDTLIQLPSVKTDGSLRRVNIPITPEMMDGVALHVSAVQQGRIFQKIFRVNVVRPNRMLLVKTIGFPEKTEPGKEVTWKIKVTDETGTPVKAEVAGVVYDASLDDILMHNWSMNTLNHWFYARQLPLIIQSDQLTYGRCARLDREKEMLVKIPQLELPQWIFERENGPVFYMMEQADETNVKVDEDVFQEKVVIRGSSSMAPKPDVTNIRSDFRETAWFGPQLTTDVNGLATVHFRMPDALTRWKFMALAHASDGKTGTSDSSFVSQKSLMIEPYPVRFLLTGDQVEFPVKVTNLSGKELEADIRLKLIEIANNDTLQPEYETRHIVLDNGASGVVKWSVKAPDKAGLYRVQVIGSSGKLSDGYEKTINVLPAKQWLVQSETFQLKPGEEKVWKPLFPMGKQQANDKWTLEWMGNPVWQAIEALPSVMSTRPRSATGLANRLYSYVTVLNLMWQYPEIEKELAIQRAKLLAQPDSVMTLMEQNDDLANIQLNETPWLDDVIREKKQLQLFIPDSIALNIADDLLRLKAMQQFNGGFSWYPEMKPNSWITTQIVDVLSTLERKNALHGKEKTLVDTMLLKAMQYLEDEMYTAYSRLTEKERKHYIPSSNIVDYLYVCSGSKIEPAGNEAKAAYRYFVQSVSQNWMKLSLYQQAQSAMILWQTDHPKKAGTILESLKERAVKDKLLGIHWRTHNSPWFYRESSLSLQSIMMQLFEETGARGTDLAAMKLWLLQQKRTHAWSTSDETVKAVEALLSGGQAIDFKTSMPTVLLNGKQLTNAISGVSKGYFKYTLPVDIPENTILELQNTGSSTGFGALYHQFYAATDSAPAIENGIAVKKTLYHIIRTEQGDSLTSNLNGIKPGDLLMVRLRIHTNRDLGFVSISDTRPAGTEPVKQLSGYESSGHLWYYRISTDNQTRFFIQELGKGDYLLEYPLRVSHLGEFSSGHVNIQCQFAPAFNASDVAGRIEISQ